MSVSKPVIVASKRDANDYTKWEEMDVDDDSLVAPDAEKKPPKKPKKAKPPKKLPPGSHRCCLDKCDAPATLACSACKTVHYCSVAHQRDAWSAHKDTCKRVQADRGDDVSGRVSLMYMALSAVLSWGVLWLSFWEHIPPFAFLAPVCACRRPRRPHSRHSHLEGA